MYRKMLIPLDGSELAETVFTYARELAGRLDIDLALVHVSSPSAQAVVPMQRAYIEHAAEVLQSQTHEVQKESGLKPKGRLVKAQGELVVGYAPEEIIRYAEENDIDLILLATHGRSGRKRWSLGSVAGKVLSAARTPILLAQAGIPDQAPYDKWPGKTLLVPLDGSEMAESVLPHVEALAGQRDSKPIDVILLRVSEPMTPPTFYDSDVAGVAVDWGEYISQDSVRRKKTAEDYLAEIEKQFKAKKIKVCAEVIQGKAKDEMVDYANQHPFSMIIMATHGRSGLSRLVYGSVAANLLQGVSNPILLIKPQQD